MPIAEYVKAEIARRHGADLMATAGQLVPALRAGVVDLICFERFRFNADFHYLVADGACAEDKELVYAVAMMQGLQSPYADLRKSTVSDWCVVVASLQ